MNDGRTETTQRHPTLGYEMAPCVKCGRASVHAAIAPSGLCLGCIFETDEPMTLHIDGCTLPGTHRGPCDV